jgi:hypothetical protein
MILSFLLLSLPMQAERPPMRQSQAPQHQAWWQELRPEDRARMHQRWKDYQNLSPENRAALHKRLDALEQERALLWRRLGEPERQQLEGLAEQDRQHWLDERVRERMRERGQSLERRSPGSCDRIRELPPAERMHRAPDFLQQEHAARARQDLEGAVKEGWIGPAAAEWLRQAPPEEVLTAMGQVQRWRFLQRAEAEGFWQKHGIAPEMKANLLELPTPFFFEEIRRLEQGDAPLGPPGNWRGGGPSGRRHRER